MQFLSVAFMVAMLLMLAMMVAQFNSFYQTFLVLSSVVMSTAGVLLGHMIFQQPFSIILGGVGIVALAGVIVHNNIILLDTYNHLRRNQPELSLIEMAVRTGAQRLRPVCLTVITAGLGLVPLALGISIDLVAREVTTRGMVAQYWKPLAASLVYGLTFATILTLVITLLLMIILNASAAGGMRARLPEGQEMDKQTAIEATVFRRLLAHLTAARMCRTSS